MLKLSKEEIKAISFCCKYHIKRWDMPNMCISKAINIYNDPNYERLLKVCYADEMSKLYLADKQKYMHTKKQITDMMDNHKRKKEIDRKVKEIIDEDIVRKHFNIKTRDISRIMIDARNYIINNNYPSREEVLYYLESNYG
jgi:hypothetical protein